MLNLHVEKKVYSSTFEILIAKKPMFLRVGPVEIRSKHGWLIVYQYDSETKIYPHSKEIFLGNDCSHKEITTKITDNFDIKEFEEELRYVISMWNKMCEENETNF